MLSAVFTSRHLCVREPNRLTSAADDRSAWSEAGRFRLERLRVLSVSFLRVAPAVETHGKQSQGDAAEGQGAGEGGFRDPAGPPTARPGPGLVLATPH